MCYHLFTAFGIRNIITTNNFNMFYALIRTEPKPIDSKLLCTGRQLQNRSIKYSCQITLNSAFRMKDYTITLQNSYLAFPKLFLWTMCKNRLLTKTTTSTRFHTEKCVHQTT